MTRATFVGVVLAALSLPGAASGQFDAHWIDATDGEWSEPNRWSTAPAYPNATHYHATIGAVGTPYRVTSGAGVTVADVVVDSADVTLAITGGNFSAPLGLHVENGSLELNGGQLVGTPLSAGPGGSLHLGATPTVLNNVTLSGVLRAYRSLSTNSTLTLDGGTVYGVEGNLNGSIVGNGEWVLGSDVACTTYSNNVCALNYDASPNIEIGAGVTVRTTGRDIRMRESSNSPSAVLVNNGTIVAESPNGYLEIEWLRNNGVIRVANGDELSVGFSGNVGQLELGPGGAIGVFGSPHFNLPVVVEDAALFLNAVSGATTVEPLHLHTGGKIYLNAAASALPIESTGGNVYLATTVTPAHLANMPVTGPAEVGLAAGFFGPTGVLDLQGSTFDYASTGYHWNFNQGMIRNGTFTGPEDLVVGGSLQNPNPLRLLDVQLDVPLQVQGLARLEGTSALKLPVVVNGGRLELYDNWANQQGITVNGGQLTLNSRPTDLGAIQMNGGRLTLGFATTRAEAEALEVGAPEQVFISNTMDLEGQTMNLETSLFNWAVGTSSSSRIINGQIVGVVDGRALGLQGGKLEGVALDSVRLTGNGTLAQVGGTNVWLDGAVMSGTVLDDSRIDGLARATFATSLGPGLTVRGELDLRGRLEGGYRTTGAFNPDIRFEAGATLTGTGEIGNTNGRIQSTNIEIVDSKFTIPAGITLISATQYDSTDRIHAPQTDLVVAGRILAGYTTTFGTPPTDSWSFEVASLRTTGAVEVTRDGRLAVTGGLWRHAGEMILTGGVVGAEMLEIEAEGMLRGWGQINLAAAPMQLAGRLEPGGAGGPLAITGDVAFATSAVTALEFRGKSNSNPANQQYDQLIVSGAAALGGALDVTVVPSFYLETIAVGDQFEIVTAEALSGSFAPTSIHFDDFSLNVLYTDTLVLLEVAEVVHLFGDYSGDGQVDAVDYTVWRDSLGDQGDGLVADGNRDGRVNTDDYLVWRAHFGQVLAGGPPLSDFATAPEPATTGSLIFGVGVALLNSSRRFKRPCRFASLARPRYTC